VAVKRPFRHTKAVCLHTGLVCWVLSVEPRRLDTTWVCTRALGSLTPSAWCADLSVRCAPHPHAGGVSLQMA